MLPCNIQARLASVPRACIHVFILMHAGGGGGDSGGGGDDNSNLPANIVAILSGKNIAASALPKDIAVMINYTCSATV